MNYDLDELMGIYADWITWLKEKETSLESQLVKMKGKPDGRPGTGDGGKAPAVSEVSLDMPPGEALPETETPPEDSALSSVSSSPSAAGDDVSPSSVSRPPSSVEDTEEDDWL